MWSTRSVASMNDVDSDERRLMMGRRGDGLSQHTGLPASGGLGGCPRLLRGSLRELRRPFRVVTSGGS
jgi:hypothetical protein